jgi:hypothetical protein
MISIVVEGLHLPRGQKRGVSSLQRTIVLVGEIEAGGASGEVPPGDKQMSAHQYPICMRKRAGVLGKSTTVLHVSSMFKKLSQSSYIDEYMNKRCRNKNAKIHESAITGILSIIYFLHPLPVLHA